MMTNGAEAFHPIATGTDPFSPSARTSVRAGAI